MDHPKGEMQSFCVTLQIGTSSKPIMYTYTGKEAIFIFTHLTFLFVKVAYFCQSMQMLPWMQFVVH